MDPSSVRHLSSRHSSAQPASATSDMTAPPLYDSEVPVTTMPYAATPNHDSRTPSMAMQMQRRMRQTMPQEPTRYRALSPSPVSTLPRGPAQWAASTPRRMSLSEDPSLSPLGFRSQHERSASPPPDGAVLPTLSTMLHYACPPQTQQQQQSQSQQPWPPRPDTHHPLAAQTMPAQLVSPTHRRAPSLPSATSPSFPATPFQRPVSASWDAAADVKPESQSFYGFSPLRISSTPRSEMTDDPMELSPRGRSGSSSPSTQSIMSNQDDDGPKTSDSPSRRGGRKTSRYLREMDRRAILERLARGEKQATLAKEYNVSRAAICNLFKHREEVMARTDEDPFAKHPKKRKNKKTLKSRRSRSLRLATASSVHGGDSRAVVTPPTAPSSVSQVQSDSVLLLLTVMSDRRSSADEFRRASERVLWLLIEEALSAVPIKLTQISIAAESKIMGVTTEHPPCALSMEQHSSPMLEVFQLLEPDRPFGQIRLLDTATHKCALVDTHLPATLKYHNVFLFDIAVVSSDTLRAMIECAKKRGALEVMIYVVALFISAEVVETLQNVYPHVRVVTTQIESNILELQKNRRSCVDVVLGRFDQVYQTQYTLVR